MLSSLPRVLSSPFNAIQGKWGGQQDWLYSLTQLPGLQALYDATAASTVTYDASNLVSAVADISGNSATGARNLVQATGANQPVYLAHSGTNYGWLNGTFGNYFSTPDSAAIDITGDIDLRVDITAADYSPALTQTLIAKDSGAPNRHYIFRIDAAGTIAVLVSADGTNLLTATSTAAAGVTDKTRTWLRATVDVDNGASGWSVNFYKSTNGTSWTKIGDTVTTATAITISSGAGVVEIGSNNGGGNQFAGSIHRAQIYAGIAGVLKADFNPELYVSGSTFTASTGEVWTVNGGAHIVKSSGIYHAGVDEFLKAATFTLAQPTTVYLVGSQVTWTSNDVVFDGNASDSGALKQTTTTPNVSINAGSAAAENTGWVLKTPAVITSVLSGASSALRVNLGTATTGNAGTASMSGFTLASAGTAGSYGNIFVSRAAIFSVAHDTATQNKVIAALARGLSISL